MTKELIENLRTATEEVARAFTEKYFPDEEYGEDTFWVADEVGSVFFVADYFFNVNRMVEALELDATYEQISDYIDLEVEHAMKEDGTPTPVNFKNFVKYGIGKKDD